MGKAWFVIRAATRQEKRAVAILEEMGWSTNEGDGKPCVYLPLETRWHRFKDQKEPITRPLFPGYLFAELGREDFASILAADGIHAIHCAHDHSGEPIVERWLTECILTVRHLEEAGEFDKTRRGAVLKAGDAVRMIQGHFTGYLGRIKHMKDGERRLTVTLDKMGDMSVDIAAVEALVKAA